MDALKTALSIFSRKQKISLLPFFVTSVFFLVQPYEPGSTFLGTIFKLLPILSLIGYIMNTRSKFPSKTKNANLDTIMPEDRYSVFVMLGLTVSVIGDIFTSISFTLFIGGALFAAVHLFYMMAINAGGRQKGKKSGCSWLFFLLFLNTFLSIQAGTESYFTILFLFFYFIPLFMAGWKAASALEENPGDKAVLLGCIGACLFIFSDCLVILEHNEYPIPFASFFYMLTYYGAQFGWAVSTSDYA
ncbi:Lysoplasmalogenase-like protein tmem86a [Mactra antiquata]